jgi:hypothetical protein
MRCNTGLEYTKTTPHLGVAVDADVVNLGYSAFMTAGLNAKTVAVS